MNNHYHQRPQFPPRQPFVQRSNSQPVQEDTVIHSIPVFKEEDYYGFKDAILAVSVPEEYSNSKSSSQPLQDMVEKSIEMNGKVVESLLQLSRVLDKQSDCLAEPRAFTNDRFIIESEERDLETTLNFIDLLNDPIGLIDSIQ